MIERAKLFAVLAGAAGGSIAIGAMEFFSARTAYPLMAIPFATSIVMVMGSPQAEPAQPRALVGGHLISPWSASWRSSSRARALGGGAGGWLGDDRDAPHRHVSSAGRDRSLVIVVNDLSGLLDRAGRRRRAAARVVRLRWHNVVARGPNKGDTWPTRWW